MCGISPITWKPEVWKILDLSQYGTAEKLNHLGDNMIMLLDQHNDLLKTAVAFVIEQQPNSQTDMQILSYILYTYLRVRYPDKKIQLISGKNKFKCLGPLTPERKAQMNKNYYQRKKLSVQLAMDALEKSNNSQMLQWLQLQDKQDDLADAYIQALWYLRQTKVNSSKKNRTRKSNQL